MCRRVSAASTGDIRLSTPITFIINRLIFNVRMLRNIFRLWMCWPVCWPCHYFFYIQCESATQFIFPRLLELCIKACFGSTVHFLSSCFPKQEAIEKEKKNTQIFLVTTVQMTIMTAQV